MTAFAPAVLQLYLEQALLVGLGWVVFWTAWRASSRSRRALPSANRWRRAALVVLAMSLVLPLATRLIPRRPVPPNAATQVAPDTLARSFAAAAAWSSRATLSIPPPQYRLRVSSVGEAVAAALLSMIAAGATVGWMKRARRHRTLRGLLCELPVIRRHGRVTLSASDVATVPFAARAGGRAWVVVPTDLLDDAPALQMLLIHELQHHRQRDLQLLAVMETLGGLFFWSPAMRAWTRLMEELQELSCDEAVVERRGRPRAYAELLLRAAGLEGRPRFTPGGVTAASGRSLSLLTRRIAMLRLRDRGVAARRARGGVVAGGVCVVLLAVAAVGARSAVLEKKLEAPEVWALAERLGRRGVSTTVNDVLLAEVNRWVATPKERAFLRDARRRLDDRRTMVEAALARHDVPSAMAAVAIVESGFVNHEPKAGFQGAGVWQFIPATARHFGLKVDAERDERLDVDRQTDAAARYLAALHKRFGDWPLALAGYNEGGQKVEAAIEQGKTRDAWELMRDGRIGRYAATVMAAALVLEGDERLLE